MNKTLFLSLLIQAFIGDVSAAASSNPSPITMQNIYSTEAPEDTTAGRLEEYVHTEVSPKDASTLPEEHSDRGQLISDVVSTVSPVPRDPILRINLSSCLNDGAGEESVVNATSGRIDVVKDGQQSTIMLCRWRITVPPNQAITIQNVPLKPAERTDDVVTVSDNTRAKTIVSAEFSYEISMTFYSTVTFLYNSVGNDDTANVSFVFWLGTNPVTNTLTVSQLSNTTYSLTSPDFDGKEQVYPNDVNASHMIRAPKDHVIVAVFTQFEVGSSDDCTEDLLTVHSLEGIAEDEWTLCGTHRRIPLRVFGASVSLTFITDNSRQYTGFEMLYSILPRSQLPEKAANSSLYNCSVPHFDAFRELFSCNLELDCEAGEDEKGCQYNNTDCGPGALNAGNKCYKIIWDGSNRSWNEALFYCSRFEYNLVTMALPNEWERFKEILSFGKRFYKLPIYVGLRLTDFIQASVKALYADVWEWVDNRAAFFLNLTQAFSTGKPQCAYYEQSKRNVLLANRCDESVEALFICEFEKENYSRNRQTISSIPLIEARVNTSVSNNVTLFPCPSGEMTRDFLSCDPEGPCTTRDLSCPKTAVVVPMFMCARGLDRLPYTLVCDHRAQCPDDSDENFCEFPSSCSANSFRCRNQQCIARNHKCDGMVDCADSSDENCGIVFVDNFPPLTYPPFIIDMTGNGRHSLVAMNETDACPPTHFPCPGGYCLPVYLRCNGFADCPGREDEMECSQYVCRGFYRCRSSSVCLHPSSVCDGAFQCPEQDDEMLCDLQCPKGCHCQGLSFVCDRKFPASSYPWLRYLDASNSGMSAEDLSYNFYLIRLHLSACSLRTVPTLTLPNLKHLDLSQNRLTTVDMLQFRSLKNLEVLVLSNNPVASLALSSSSSAEFTSLLKTIDLSYTRLEIYNDEALLCCKGLKTLNISSSDLMKIAKTGFDSTPNLEKLDISNSPLRDFPLDMLRKLSYLQTVSVDNYKLCCQATLPENFVSSNCHYQQDVLASCADLVQSVVYRVFLWLFAALSLCGNLGSFAIRIYLHKGGGSTGSGSFGIFVTNLSLADFFMGVYLTIIGAADQIYRGSYLWKEEQWKRSVTCNVAGFLSLLSTEVSAFIICLITFDRFLVLRFPFSRLHFHRKSALVACGVAWTVGVVLAAVPLLSVTRHWEFYGQTSICIPLPFSMSSRFWGYRYSFSVIIVLNFVLFLLIALGQLVIYLSVRINSLSNQNTSSRDATIARRLTSIVVSDFFCWFPVGVLGLVASTGYLIPRVVSVGVAIFVLPFNAALNPFLYTFNIVMEKRRKTKDELHVPVPPEVRVNTEMSSKTDEESKISRPVKKESAIGQLETWLGDKVIAPEDVISCLVPLIRCEFNTENRTLSCFDTSLQECVNFNTTVKKDSSASAQK